MALCSFQVARPPPEALPAAPVSQPVAAVPSEPARTFGRRLAKFVPDVLRRFLGTQGLRRSSNWLVRHAETLDRKSDDLAARMQRLESLIGTVLQASRADETAPRLDTLDRRLENVEALTRSFASIGTSQHEKLDRLLNRGTFPLAGDTVAVRSPYGFVVVPGEDIRQVAALVDGNLQEPATFKVLDALLRPGCVFVDVGANVGTLTLFAARRVGPAGRVVALEPVPRLAECLRTTVSMNWVEDVVRVHEVAAGTEGSPTSLNVALPYGHSSLFSLPDAVETVPVRVVSLDGLLGADHPLDVVKIDTEGADLDVLLGMQQLLEFNTRVVVVVEFCPAHLERRRTSVEDWVGAIRGFGLQLWEIHDDSTTLHPLRGQGLHDITSINLLLARRLPGALKPLLRGAVQ